MYNFDRRPGKILSKIVGFVVVFFAMLMVMSLGTFASESEDQFVYSSDIPLSSDVQQYLYDSCMEWDIEYELALALIWRESRFQSDAVGYNTNGTCDSGLMQINDCNRGWLYEEHGIDNLLDPYQNIDAGTIILGGFIQKYGDANTALMAYQYGEAGMRRKFAQGVYTNSQIYNLMVKADEFRTVV